jgi:hypothetical protein
MTKLTPKNTGVHRNFSFCDSISVESIYAGSGPFDGAEIMERVAISFLNFSFIGLQILKAKSLGHAGVVVCAVSVGNF